MKAQITLKNIGDAKLPVVFVGKKYGFYESSGSGPLAPARTRHGLIRDITSQKSEFAAGKKRQDNMRSELAKVDYLPVWSVTVLYDPSQGTAGAFYRFSRATKAQVVFKYWRAN